MSHERRELLRSLTQGGWHQQCPVTVIGAAVMDMVVSADALPPRGGDVAAKMQGFHLGGCALNIAVALKQLGIESRNLLPVGEGPWADRLRDGMARRGLRSDLPVSGEDNGWCMALVEPDGERTFISIDGVENQWQAAWLERAAPVAGLAYLSGYQLSAAKGGVLIDWMLRLPPTVRVVLDIGPRIDVIDAALLQRLIRPGVILTLNQREAQHLACGAISAISAAGCGGAPASRWWCVAARRGRITMPGRRTAAGSRRAGCGWRTASARATATAPACWPDWRWA